MEFLTLIVILSSVNGNHHWHPFPLPYVNYYHVPNIFSRSFSIPPLISNPGYSVLPKTYHDSTITKLNTNIDNIYSTASQRPLFVQSGERISSNEFTSGNIVKQTEAQAESTLEILKSLRGSNIAAQYTPASAASTRFQPLSQDFINNFGLQDTGRRNFVSGQEPSNRFTSGNIVQNAKAQAEETIRILKAFEGSSIAAEYIEPTFATSDCLNNLEDVTKLIQAGTDLIVDNGPELIYLEALVQSLKGETDVVKLTKATAKMLRALDGLGPALAAGASDLCISSPEASIKGFQDLADVLEDLSNNNDINMPTRSRELLKISAKIMDQTAEFLETQNNALETFRTQCESGNKSQIAIYDSTREILDSLAKLYEVMGFEDRSVHLKKQSDFIKKFGDSYSELDRLGIDIDCSLVGDYKSLAQILEDLVVIIESVGLEKLSEELGINFDFNSV